MKIYVEVDNSYILLSEEIEKDNINNYLIRNEIISNAMDKLEDYKMRLEVERHIANPVKMKKLGVHPNMKAS